MISPSGGVEDKYGQYINYRNEVFNMDYYDEDYEEMLRMQEIEEQHRREEERRREEEEMDDDVWWFYYGPGSDDYEDD